MKWGLPQWGRHLSQRRQRKHPLEDILRCRAGSSLAGITTTSPETNETEDTRRHRAFVAVGSNLGNRYENIATALEMLCESSSGTTLRKTSFLHQTAPMYVTDQPAFLNGAVEIETGLEPHSLLNRLKWVEHELGRNFSEVRNGPRPVDLDVIFFDTVDETTSKFTPILLDAPDLVIPHRLMQERAFVLVPMVEVAGEGYVHPVLNSTMKELLQDVTQGSLASTDPSTVRVMCIPRGRILSFHETIIMGILNVTPDSFSDGGKWNSSIDVAVEHALRMEKDGAGIIDIGGESTRPGAPEISIEEQIRRTVPVIQSIRKATDVPISIDTRHAAVAKAAIEAGADIVNDVSGGTFDNQMLPTVASLRVPIILMHMRGTPESMQTMTEYNDVVDDVIAALLERSKAAELAGIPRWLQVVDPGIGFAKDQMGNLRLLKNLNKIRKELEDMPLLLGTSRKGFIGQLTNVIDPEDRDYGTIGSCIAALCLGDDEAGGCDILRVHNVKAAKDACVVMDAIRRARMLSFQKDLGASS
jgi:dihydropteroate synthase/2-amino-4-hydroxy-6-hydroxymethyldihydropteridine diphosphokinase